ncbi:heavy metal translocating P-type ATPase [Kiloniella sp. b19]|uniref:heavy metal translocating P-type ATPase n=1 Tax=Kiloniella sp. GXU_MW_B19 TaxID=3141326 RepID=UPI0031D2E550
MSSCCASKKTPSAVETEQAGCCPSSKMASEQPSAAGCCSSQEGQQAEQTPQQPATSSSALDPSAYVRKSEDGLSSLHLIVDSIHCPSCIRQIEGNMKKLPGIKSARVTLATKRLAVTWDEEQTAATEITALLERLNFPPTPFNPELLSQAKDEEDKSLLRAMGVAGFASANIMILSISVWSGEELGSATRDLFHWISALIALPTVAYSGRPFFRSAFASIRAGSLNMDVPISLAVLLATIMSVVQTWHSEHEAYFDAGVMLLFFLLIGRYLDRRMRTKAHSAAQNLLSLRAVAATVLEQDGSTRSLPVEQIEPGMQVAVASGETIPVDGTITKGETELDTTLVTGESLPQSARQGDAVYAGTVNMGQPIEVHVTSRDEGTLLAEIVRLMEAAQQGRAKYIRLADRAAQIYAPAVHTLSLLTFLGWYFIGDASWQIALLNAIAVLIITCPCALGLAVPAVQVVASGILLKRGVLVKSADGLERLAAADTIVFDKTGTLTEGHPRLQNSDEISPVALAMAASLALRSKHPLARAVTLAAPDTQAAENVEEVSGQGLRCLVNGKEVRIGKREWCSISDEDALQFASKAADAESNSELWLRVEGENPVHFTFDDRLRLDAADTMKDADTLLSGRYLLSGDREKAVARVARTLGFGNWTATASPKDKISQLEQLAGEGRKVLMVGDGLNDAPALSAAYVSASPATGTDVSQTAADFIIQGRKLRPLMKAISVARKARYLIFENFGLALVYNLVAVPVAMAGLVTPLIASVAMSGSSILVIINALRLKLDDRDDAI